MKSDFKYFLSLKWKAVLLLSVVLFLANAALAVLFYLTTIDRLELQQNKNLEQQNRGLQSLLQVDVSQMQSFAEILPLYDYALDINQTLPDKLKPLLENHGELINASWGIEQLLYYSSDGRILYHWFDQNNSNSLKNLALSVIEKEEPQSLLQCFSGRCEHVVAIPVLGDNQQVYALLLFRSLREVLLNFVELTQADITLAKALGKNNDSTLVDDILLSSNRKEVGRLFNSISKRQLEELKQNGKLRINIKNEWYEIHEFQALDGEVEPSFIITNKVTELILNIENTVFNSVFIGLIGFLISEISLLLLLSYPMTRLQRVTTSLPLLAKGKFIKFRDALKEDQLQRIAADEIDIVEENIINTSLQLERYQIEKQQQAVALKNERDFVTKLIEGAPVIILSQTLDNVVTQINKQGISLSHLNEDDIVDGNFLKIFVCIESSNTKIKNFRSWIESGAGICQQEIEMPALNGNSKVIHWTHSMHNFTENKETLILSIGVDLSDRIAAEQNLSWLATHDSLTEIANRRYFESNFENILNQHVRYGHSGALLFFDLDQFKYVNDVSGHHSGDKLLKMVALNVAKLIRSSDIFARLGGDEFAIILPETNEEESKIVATKILETLELTTLATDAFNHKVSASIGITFFPKHGEDVITLMAHADIAMYQAKYQGRGRWYVFTSEDKTLELLSSKAYWREKIDDALDNDQFILHFQPIINIKENKVTHYEALIRMKEDDALIYPDNFIPIAEQTGQIHAIDQWVVTRAFAILEENPDVSLAVNLSSSALTSSTLVSVIEELMIKHKILPQRVIFEITETAAVENLISAVSIMNDIRTLGFKFALDDFGTGFSSFAYLKKLPANLIKIDGSFVKELAGSKDDQLFIRAINDVTMGLGKEAVAEYVESEEILTMLKEIGVTYAQGYYIGKPKAEFL